MREAGDCLVTVVCQGDCNVIESMGTAMYEKRGTALLQLLGRGTTAVWLVYKGRGQKKKIESLTAVIPTPDLPPLGLTTLGFNF